LWDLKIYVYLHLICHPHLYHQARLSVIEEEEEESNNLHDCGSVKFEWQVSVIKSDQCKAKYGEWVSEWVSEWVEMCVLINNHLFEADEMIIIQSPDFNLK